MSWKLTLAYTNLFQGLQTRKAGIETLLGKIKQTEQRPV